MSLSLAPAHLKRYAEVARLFVKYGRGPLAADLSQELPSPEPAKGEPDGGKPEELADRKSVV